MGRYVHRASAPSPGSPQRHDSRESRRLRVIQAPWLAPAAA